MTIEYLSAQGHGERFPALAAECVRGGATIIATTTTPAAQAAKTATTTIPIVMLTSGDPVGAGLVRSLAKPGGNVTGQSFMAAGFVGKRLGLLKEAAPSISRVLGDLASAFAAGVAEGANAVMVTSESLFFVNRARVMDLATKHRLPGAYPWREYPVEGGLMSYAHRPRDLFRRAAEHVDRILNGAKPEDLPVEQPTKFDLVINMKSAKALGLSIPPSLLLRADEVIE